MLTVAVTIDAELGLTITKEMRIGSTIADLKDLLAMDDPTGQTTAHSLVLGRLNRRVGDSPLDDTEVLSESLLDLVVGSADDAPSSDEMVRQDTPTETALGGTESHEHSPEHSSGQIHSWWRVVHERIVRRAEASTKAAALSFARRGDLMTGVVFEAHGVPWLRTTHVDKEGHEIECFCMIDGASVGLGLLLERAVNVSYGDYYVTRVSLFKKPGTDPESQKVIRISRAVGSVVHTTAKTWTGSSGGVWVELDSLKGEKPGWMLVEGPGFGITGPCLKLACASDGPPMVLHMPKPRASAVAEGEDPDVREFLVFPGTTVSETKAVIASLFNCAKHHFILARSKNDDGQTAGNIDNMGSEDLLADDDTMWEGGFRNGSELPFIYTGNFDAL